MIPVRKSVSAMKSEMHRFLWMVLRSLCRPRKKQKVKMHTSRHTRDSRMPTHVMTSNNKSCTGSAVYEEKEREITVVMNFVVYTVTQPNQGTSEDNRVIVLKH